MVHRAGLRVVDGRGEGGDRGVEAFDEFGADQPADPAHRHPEGGGRELPGGHPGHPVDEFVGLVDHQHVVLGQHRRLGDRVDRQ